MKTSWSEITIDEFYKIREITENEDLSPAEKDIKVLSLLASLQEEELWSMPIQTVTELLSNTKFLDKFIIDKKLKFHSITLNGVTYSINPDVNKMNYAQYVDFQQYWHNKDTEIEKLLSVFVIPKGHKYNEGYDPVNVQIEIRNSLSIIDAENIAFFLLKKLVNSTRAIQISLVTMMKAKIMMTRDKKLKERLKKEMSKIRSLGFTC